MDENSLSQRFRKANATPNADAALADLADLLKQCSHLPPVSNSLGQQVPQAMALLVTGAIAQRLLDMGRGADILPMLRATAAVLAPRYNFHSQGDDVARLMTYAPFLSVPLILAALQAGAAEDAMMQLQVYASQSDLGRKAWLPWSQVVADLVAAPEIAAMVRLDMGPGWLLDRQLQARAGLAPDFTRERFVAFDETILLTAIAADRFADVAGIVDGHLAAGDRLESLPRSHLGFNAFCILAALGRHTEAIALAERMIRHGYGLAWRFRPDAGKDMGWIVAMGQEKCMRGLFATPEYQAFLARCVQWAPPQRDDPAVALLASVADGIWSGKKAMTCKLTRTRIAPGAPVVRLRRLFDWHGVGDVEIADAGAFARTGWQTVRRQFETNTLPVSGLFPGLSQGARAVLAPRIAALMADMADAPDALDLAHLAQVLGQFAPPARRFMWMTGPDRAARQPAFDPFAEECGQGAATTLLWRLWKGGQMPALLGHIAALPPEQADKVMALIACFDDGALRAAAAAHFAMPDLPARMALAFDPRQTLQDYRTLADYGRDNPRFRHAMVAAMASCGLHLYSNNAPTVNWYLAGLEQFGMAHGSQLLWFVIHSPADDPVLATMLARHWLPQGLGKHDAYENSGHYYYRAAALHLAFNDPAGFRDWQQIGWMKDRLTMAVDRKTYSLLARI
ncbi:MAG: hypothetical protein GW886_10845 [Rhodobacterales bacterium]|nr:hypothetical protein [Rhodobacterales bacterium]